MLDILWKVCVVSILGFVILLVRKLWGKNMYPQIMMFFWWVFLLCALMPMGSIGLLGKVATDKVVAPDVDIIYERDENLWAIEQEEDSLIGIVEMVTIGEWICIAVMCIWGMGVVVVCMINLKASQKIRKEIISLCKKELPREVLQELCIEVETPIYLTEGVGPMVYGIKPVIYIPECLRDSSILKNVVLHEMMHIRKKHHLVLLLMQVVSILYWMLPFVDKCYMTALKEDLEFVCDYAVINECGINRKMYAEHCVIMGETKRKISQGLTFGKKNLKKRVEFILQSHKSVMKSLGALFLFGVVIGLGLVWYSQNYIDRDVNGFSRIEVYEAKQALILFFQAVRENDEKTIKGFLTEDGPYTNTAWSWEKDKYVIYDVTYEPEKYSYYYARKYFDSRGLDGRNSIYLICNMELNGKERIIGYYLVREDGKWKLYDGEVW